MGTTVQVVAEQGVQKYPLVWVHRGKHGLSWSHLEFSVPAGGEINGRVKPNKTVIEGYMTYHDDGRFTGRNLYKKLIKEERLPSLSDACTEPLELVGMPPNPSREFLQGTASTLKHAPGYEVSIDLDISYAYGFSLYLQLVQPRCSHLPDPHRFFMDSAGHKAIYVAQSHIFTEIYPWVALHLVAPVGVLSPFRKLYP